MSFAYAIRIAINWGNEACILTFTTTFGLNHIVMILHKRDWLESQLRSLVMYGLSFSSTLNEEHFKQLTRFFINLEKKKKPTRCFKPIFIKLNDGGSSLSLMKRGLKNTHVNALLY